MKTSIINLTPLIMILASLLGCSSSNHGQQQDPSAPDTVRNAVVFNADSAKLFVKAQCDFGPRVPNTEAHRLCGKYLADKLRSFGANVIEQDARLKAFDGTVLNAKNIIAEFNPDSVDNRILLLAHWDSRPWADSDPDASLHKSPVMGANDGASGVGVLLEMARLFAQTNPECGVDILFVDAEDWGDSEGADENSWGLGTQYWTENRHRQGYQPAYGILLDMVGASNACFSMEYFSLGYARNVVNKVWAAAQRSGYGSYFPSTEGGAITDDHVFICRAGIPCIDIIDMRRDSDTGFFPQWHTSGDTFDVIDAATLKAVGQTLVNLIYAQ